MSIVTSNSSSNYLIYSSIKSSNNQYLISDSILPKFYLISLSPYHFFFNLFFHETANVADSIIAIINQFYCYCSLYSVYLLVQNITILLLITISIPNWIHFTRILLPVKSDSLFLHFFVCVIQISPSIVPVIVSLLSTWIILILITFSVCMCQYSSLPVRLSYWLDH